MIIALAQINPVIGDLSGNLRRIQHYLELARAADANLAIFPELTLCGYPPKDLLLKPRFVSDCVRAAEELAREMVASPAALVGYVRPNERSVGRALRNVLGYLHGGKIQAECCKTLLPTYDVFDEHRYFEPAESPSVIEWTLDGQVHRIGVTICEDLWNDKRILGRELYDRHPSRELQRAGVEIIVNSSASPFVMGKQALREQLMGGQAAELRIPIVYVNQVGGNDELIFDGASCVFAADGSVIARARAFEEDLVIFDTERADRASREPYPEDLVTVWRALVLGTRDYVTKCGFTDVVLGLSGGIDSALTACIAVEALGPAHVHGVAMPSRYSSDHSLADAHSLARNLGIDYQVIPIGPMHEAFEKHLTPAFRGRPPDTTEENVQARIRGNILMSLSNKFGWLLLTTGNKSELAVGYCTLYGDMCGGLAVISDVPKTMVYKLARWLNVTKGKAVIPESSITKVPSAELRPNQSDQDTLPPYELLDDILHRYIELEQSAADIVAAGFDEQTIRKVIRMVDVNEYKRKQAATGLKVTSRAFGVGRRMPIAAKFS